MDQSTKGKYSKLFLIAALWNLSIGGGALLLPALPPWNLSIRGTDLLVPVLINKLMFGFESVVTYGITTFGLQLAYALIVIFGIGYYFVSRNTEKNRGIVWMGIIGKLAVFSIALTYYPVKIITLFTMLLCFGDFVFACLFIFFLVETRN
jgi:hypothetical protein